MALAEAESFGLQLPGLKPPLLWARKGKEDRLLSSLCQASAAPLPQTPAGPTQPTRPEAKGPSE